MVVSIRLFDFSNRAEPSYFGRLMDLFKFKDTEEEQIKSGGYVIDSIEAAIWCLLNTDHYRDCVLKAVNLGDDTDTTAAIAGGLAGIFYGYDGIPETWKKAVLKREWIERMCGEAAAW